VGSRLFKLLPRETPTFSKATLHFLYMVVIVPNTSTKLKSSILKIGYFVVYVTISNSPQLSLSSPPHSSDGCSSAEERYCDSCAAATGTAKSRQTPVLAKI